MKSSLNIDKLAKFKWHYIHKRFRTPFYTYLLWEGVSRHHNSNLSLPYEMGAVLYLNGELMFVDDIWRQTQSLVIRQLEIDKSFIIKIFNKAYKINDRIERLARSLNEREISSYTNKQIISFIESYCQLCFSSAAFMIFPLFIEEYLAKKVAAGITEKFGAKALEIIHGLSVPSKFSSTEEEELSLLKIALRQRNKQSVEKEIDSHLLNYGWLKNSAMDDSYYSRRDILKRLDFFKGGNIAKRIKVIMGERRRRAANVRAYRTKLGLSARLVTDIDTLQEAIYFRSWRTERFYHNIQYLSDLIIEIAQRLGIEKASDVFYLLPTEISSLLENNLLAKKAVIAERKGGYIMWGDGKKTDIFSGKIVGQAERKIKFMDAVNQSYQEIKGQAACKGKAMGKVNIIKHKKEFRKMKLNNILVTPSTTPAYVPIMKKASAIITDEGGLTCHAAIMSRELGIPCIIGTKIGTRVLKDGDLVEVDADKGLVKILKR